jgi:hypothetical protein
LSHGGQDDLHGPRDAQPLAQHRGFLLDRARHRDDVLVRQPLNAEPSAERSQRQEGGDPRPARHEGYEPIRARGLRSRGENNRRRHDDRWFDRGWDERRRRRRGTRHEVERRRNRCHRHDREGDDEHGVTGLRPPFPQRRAGESRGERDERSLPGEVDERPGERFDDLFAHHFLPSASSSAFRISARSFLDARFPEIACMTRRAADPAKTRSTRSCTSWAWVVSAPRAS